MQIMSIKPMQLLSYTRIGNVIPLYHVTAVIGLPSAGKTYSMIKFLNMQGVRPIHFNLDETIVPPELSAFSIEGKHIKSLEEFTDLKDQVLLIDTYQLMIEELELVEDSKADQKAITKKLLRIAKEKECTIIVLGHSEEYASKDGIFTANPLLIRSAAEHIVMTSKATSRQTGNTVTYHTAIRKGRGVGGTRLLDDWLREPMMNPLTNKMC